MTDLGKVKRVHTNVPGAVPVVIPKRTQKPTSVPVQKPIHVPNWPTKKPVPVKRTK